MRHKLIFFVVVLALTTFIAALAACDRTEDNAGAKAEKTVERLTSVSINKIRPTVIKDVLILPGETEPLYDLHLAADLDGRVEWIGPKEGVEVEDGQLIAKIDVSSLKAVLESAKASFELADNLYQRRKQLFERGVFAKEELDRSLTQRTQALNTLRQAKVEYDRGFVRSTIRGVINKIHVDEGEYVGRGASIADIVNVVKIKISVNVPESDVRFIKTGDKALVTVDAFPENSFAGDVEFVAFKADPGTKTFEARVVMFNQGRDIRPGMIARAHFLRRIIPDAIVVPLSSLVDKGGERIIYVEKDGIVFARTVKIGVIQGDVVQIVNGLEPGEHLIVTGQSEVEEGMKVVVK